MPSSQGGGWLTCAMQTFATEDNLAFSLELPSAITDTWDLPSADDIVIDDDLPLWSPLPDESAPTLARQPSPPSSRTEHIDYIPTSIGRVDSGSPEASAIELSNDDILASVSNDFQDEKAGSTGGVHHIENSVDLTEPVKAAWTVQDDTKMDLIDLDSGDESDDPMRLRGGAGSDEGEEAGDEEEDDGEEFDEDEVELGLLQPMPKEGEKAWDVDFAVGKVGGLPVWLDPTSPLRVEDVECGVCGDTMSMLLQVCRALVCTALFRHGCCIIADPCSSHLIFIAAGQLPGRYPTSRRRSFPLRLRMSQGRLPLNGQGQGSARVAHSDA